MYVNRTNLPPFTEDSANLNFEVVGKLVVIAFIISIPLAWHAMDKWLQSFAYKISIDGSVFVYAGVGALIVALLTVSFESIKAATTNPVDSLKDE